MLVVGLTGGVGSGKSTVAGLLTLHGAFLIDADLVAREVVAPETPALAAIEQRFGSQYITRTGELDRRSLGKLVFSDKSSLADLNAIVHPLVREHIFSRLDFVRQDVGARRGAEHTVVVLMVPLLLESGHYPTDVVVVVDCDPDLALQRLTESRGWTGAEAQERMSVQLSREERNAKADYLIDNSGSTNDLGELVAVAWKWIIERIP